MQGIVVAVDPGLRACGVAVFLDGVLVRALAVPGGLGVRGPAAWRDLAERVRVSLHGVLHGAPPGLLVVETMKVYTQGPGDPSDLIELAGVAGAVVGALPAGWQVAGVSAATWNGQVPSKIRRARTRAWVEERGALGRVDLDTTARFQQDVWSAIGIGRYVVEGGRLG